MLDLPHITALLASPDPEVRRNALNALDYVAAPDAAFALAIPLLKDADPQVRATAASLLDLIKNSDAVTPLLEMMRTETDEDAYEAGCTTLSRFASPEICAFFRAVALGQCTFRGQAVRQAAARNLRNCPSHASTVALQALSQDKDAGTSLWALESLRLLTRKWPVLRRRLKNPKPTRVLATRKSF